MSIFFLLDIALRKPKVSSFSGLLFMFLTDKVGIGQCWSNGYYYRFFWGLQQYLGVPQIRNLIFVIFFFGVEWVDHLFCQKLKYVWEMGMALLDLQLETFFIFIILLLSHYCGIGLNGSTNRRVILLMKCGKYFSGLPV